MLLGAAWRHAGTCREAVSFSANDYICHEVAARSSPGDAAPQFWAPRKDLIRGQSQSRVAPARGDFRQRDQHEAAIRSAGVRQIEAVRTPRAWSTERAAAVVDEVEIECP